MSKINKVENLFSHVMHVRYSVKLSVESCRAFTH